MSPKQEFADQAADYASKVQYIGSGATAIFGLTLNEIGVLVGIVVAVLGFLVNWYYKHKAFLLREQAHNAQMNSRNRRSTDLKYFNPDSEDDE